MMTGLGFLQFFSYYLKKTHMQRLVDPVSIGVVGESAMEDPGDAKFDFFHRLARAEWDTLLFFFGDSMLSIGSAAGVALMGQARGKYTFFGHLKWTPVIILGYAVSIVVHLWLNADTFSIPVTPG